MPTAYFGGYSMKIVDNYIDNIKYVYKTVIECQSGGLMMILAGTNVKILSSCFYMAKIFKEGDRGLSWFLKNVCYVTGVPMFLLRILIIVEAASNSKVQVIVIFFQYS